MHLGRQSPFFRFANVDVVVGDAASDVYGTGGTAGMGRVAEGSYRSEEGGEADEHDRLCGVLGVAIQVQAAAGPGGLVAADDRGRRRRRRVSDVREEGVSASSGEDRHGDRAGGGHAGGEEVVVHRRRRERHHHHHPPYPAPPRRMMILMRRWWHHRREGGGRRGEAGGWRGEGWQRRRRRRIHGVGVMNAVFEKNAGICGSVGVVCPWSRLAFIFYYDVRTVIYLSSNRLQSTSSVPECAPKVVYVST